MNICSKRHDTIAYDGGACPLCETRTDLQDEIDSLIRKIENLQNELRESERHVEALTRDLDRASELS